MSDIPAFLRKGAAMPPAPPAKPATAHGGAVRCGSFALMAQGALWKYTLLHASPDHTLIWVTRGQGRVIVSGVRRGISMHNALFLPAGTLFATDLPTGTQALMVQSPAGLTGRMPREPLLLRVRDSLSQVELTAEIDSMSRELSQNRPHMDEALEARMRLVAVWLRRQVAAGAVDASRPTAAQKLVRRYAQAVVRDFRSAKLMADYAEDLDVTPTHLTRVCQKSCGKTAGDILTEITLHAARGALESPKPAIQDIAKGLGFNSPAYFTRFIQNHTGKSPSALRRAAIKKGAGA